MRAGPPGHRRRRQEEVRSLHEGDVSGRASLQRFRVHAEVDPEEVAAGRLVSSGGAGISAVSAANIASRRARSGPRIRSRFGSKPPRSSSS